MSKLPELTDTQIMLILKQALDYNAEIVKAASFIYGQELKQSARQKLYRDFRKTAQDYGKRIEAILEEQK